MTRFYKYLLIAVNLSVLTLFSATLIMAGEAGLVTYVSGDVFYTERAESKERAVSFMKAKTGDIYFLGDDSSINIVYFKNGRKEKWHGAVDIKISEERGIALSSEKEPSVTTLKNTAEGLRAIPNFIKDLNTERTGGVTMRSLGKKYREYEELPDSEKEKVIKTKALYDEMLKESEKDDVTPELYSIGILSQLDLYKETLGLVKAALKKQPENEGLKLMKDNLQEIISKK